MAATGRPITIFNVLALLFLIGGGGATLVLSFWHIDSWIDSGETWEVGKTQRVELSPGELVVFFESPGPLPAIHDQVHLIMRDESRQQLFAQKIPVSEEETYAPRPFLSFTRYSGRPLWRVQVPQQGIYSMYVQNDHEERAFGEERVAIGKDPSLFSMVHDVNNRIKIAGLSLTGALFVGCYILHGVALARRTRLRSGGAAAHPVPADGDDF